MNVTLAHLNVMPLLYGVVLFVATVLIIKNIATFQLFRAAAIIGILWLGFEIHGHASDTRMAVAIAALGIDLIWPFMFGRK